MTDADACPHCDGDGRGGADICWPCGGTGRASAIQPERTDTPRSDGGPVTDNDLRVRCPRCSGTGVWQPDAEVARRMAWRFTIVSIVLVVAGYLLGMAVTVALGWAGVR